MTFFKKLNLIVHRKALHCFLCFFPLGTIFFAQECKGMSSRDDYAWMIIHYSDYSAPVHSISSDQSTVTMIDQYGYTPIFYALKNKNRDIVIFFLEKLKRIKLQEKDLYKEVQLIVENNNVEYALILQASAPEVINQVAYLSIKKNRPDILKALIAGGLDVNGCNYLRDSPFICSTTDSGHFELATILIDAGCNVDQQDKFGRRALYLLLKNFPVKENDRDKKLKFLEKLLTSGASPNIIGKIEGFNTHWSPLHRTVYNFDVEATSLLIQSGADVNIRVRDKGTPLHFLFFQVENQHATSQTIKELFQLLVTAGANSQSRDCCGENSDTKDCSGRTPLGILLDLDRGHCFAKVSSMFNYIVTTSELLLNETKSKRRRALQKYGNQCAIEIYIVQRTLERLAISTRGENAFERIVNVIQIFSNPVNMHGQKYFPPYVIVENIILGDSDLLKMALAITCSRILFKRLKVKTSPGDSDGIQAVLRILMMQVVRFHLTQALIIEIEKVKKETLCYLRGNQHELILRKDYSHLFKQYTNRVFQ